MRVVPTGTARLARPGLVGTGSFEKLPNEFAALGTVIIQAFVGPLARDQHPAPGNTQVFELVSFALAASGCHGVSSALGLDPIKQPYRTARRARGDLQFGVQPMDVIPLCIGGALVDAGGLVNSFSQIFGEGVLAAIRAHERAFPPVEVTLPWGEAGGKKS